MRKSHYLDSVLRDENGNLPLYSHAFYSQIPNMDLRVWAAFNAVYSFPTTELIDFLKNKIDGKKSIEIAAGNNGLYRHLGIPATDSYMQQRPEIKLYYQCLGQSPTNPTPDVEQLDALDAIQKYKPDIAIASWLTQKFQEGDTSGNMDGADEEEILKNVDCYILIGNKRVHGEKRILAQPHEEICAPWLISRASFPEQNVIYIWRK